MCSHWEFGWTQVLTIAGLIMTALISFLGLRTFGKWKREKLEEKKIEIAFEFLAIAYELKYAFEAIRSPFCSSYEYQDLPKGR